MNTRYAGIDKSGLNRIASLDAMNKVELILCVNSYWFAAYGHPVLIGDID